MQSFAASTLAAHEAWVWSKWKQLLANFLYIIFAVMAPLASGTATLVSPNPNGDPQIMPKTFNIRIEVGASALDALQLALEPASAAHYRTHGLNSTMSIATQTQFQPTPFLILTSPR